VNVIVSNRYAAMLSNLNIDLIKSINGEFEVDNLISQFDNFFFNKMILDITAIKIIKIKLKFKGYLLVWICLKLYYY